ncbi:Uncharacterized protein YjbI, contains pentapeptide repeats [Streptacidiphilus jiangxiensis]|uniref:Uncharacterized protein YjbI, contains pentapeptide repeats n=1 Tax=Streptacidiphilus jiangxiensis TaxID=235985 RepID=A0A1H7WIY9_STRJI|nr:Uncharacterized protein YjbI, contains pentapeptide repeats [Streptacidiphilus jiangxiensis]
MGCRGIAVPGHTRCLPHLLPADQNAYLAALGPGADIDLSGTTLDEQLLTQLLTALTDPATNKPVLGKVDFGWATFSANAFFGSATFGGDAFFGSATFGGDAFFGSATFADRADFHTATFTGTADFRSATFTDNANFGFATFTGRADFRSATITDNANFGFATFRYADFGAATFTSGAVFGFATFRYADFGAATFSDGAGFGAATFSDGADFGAATFSQDADFGAATFTSGANFRSATFTHLQRLGPMLGLTALDFDGARFGGPQVVVEAAAPQIHFDGVLFSGTASLRLRFAAVSLDRAVLAGPTALQAWPTAFPSPEHRPLDESPLVDQGHSPGVRLASLEGVDAAHLVLTDINLTDCRFARAFHLDQIRIGFGCTFQGVPTGWRRRGPVALRWSPRRTLAEEQHYRALSAGALGAGWTQGPQHPDEAATPGADDLAGLYQQLRKAFEDGGNEPDAADFYYGEMEMRRVDPLRPRAERWLLWLYWLLSGYGLRASRALAWLGTAMATTALVLMLVGLPNADPQPVISGSDRAGTVSVVSSISDPALTLPLGQRITQGRLQKAALVVVNSVVFRSSGQNLTTWGTVVEMLSRISEPALLTLAALAIRGRVKR